jgi:hypothetical protein
MTKNVKLSFRASKNTQVPIKGAPETSIKAYLTINKFLCSLLENVCSRKLFRTSY